MKNYTLNVIVNAIHLILIEFTFHEVDYVEFNIFYYNSLIPLTIFFPSVEINNNFFVI